jgi:hypothetical protein
MEKILERLDAIDSQLADLEVRLGSAVLMRVHMCVRAPGGEHRSVLIYIAENFVCCDHGRFKIVIGRGAKKGKVGREGQAAAAERGDLC